jgi:hypothetical protein
MDIIHSIITSLGVEVFKGWSKDHPEPFHIFLFPVSP